MWYVSMTDKFMSGWSCSEGKINKYVVECETLSEARTIERNAIKRSDMKYVNVCSRKPYYPSNTHLTTLVTYNGLGETWKL